MKRNIILLHGALGNKEQFKELELLLKDHYQTWAFDFDGHGKSTSDLDFSIELFVQNTLNFMETNHIESADFFGYSMGGYVALKLACLYPEKVKSIVTLGTKFEWSPEISTNEVKKLQPDIIEEKVPKFADLLKNKHLNWKANMRKTAEMMMDLGNGKAMLDKDFTKIESPCLLCIGDKDNMSSIEETAKTSAYIPNGRYLVMSNTVHEFNHISPKELQKIIKNYHLDIP